MALLLTVLALRKVTPGANAGATEKGQHHERGERRGSKYTSSITPRQPGRKGVTGGGKALSYPSRDPLVKDVRGLVPVYVARPQGPTLGGLEGGGPPPARLSALGDTALARPRPGSGHGRCGAGTAGTRGAVQREPV